MTDGGWGTWAGAMYLCGQEVCCSTVGIVGLGRIGMAVARRIRGFGISRLVYCDILRQSSDIDVGAEFVEFDELLKVSDFVIMCCSVTEFNKGIVDKSAFGKMKKNAVFVNVARGILVNQTDLYDALKTGQIFSAGLDVTTPEPINLNNPLLTLNNCIITPHVASSTARTVIGMAQLAARNVLAGLKGQSLPAPVPNYI